MTEATVLALLDVARDLTAQDRFNAPVVLRILEYLQRSGLDRQALGAVTHARLAAQSARDGNTTSRGVIARLALARVVTLLEAKVAA